MTAGSGGPPVQRLTAAMLLQGPLLAEVRWVLREGAREIWRRDGIPPSAAITHLLRELGAVTSSQGHEDVPEVAEPEGLISETRISTADAAEVLELSPRQLRRLRDHLGARKVGGVLTFD